MRHQFGALVFLVATAGCATAPPNPDPGPYPQGHAQLFAAYLSASLKDPASARIQLYGGPAPFLRSAGLLSGGMSGWAACYAVNAKNSFGGYTGAKAYMPIYRDGRLLDVQIGGGNIYTDAEISNFCRSAASAPRPQAPGAQPSESPAAPAAAPIEAKTPSAPAPTAARATGKDAYVAERLARQLKCTDTTPATLVGKGAGYESYSMACTNGETLLIRCEFGNCRALR